MIDLILATLATWRIALFLATEEWFGVPWGDEEKRKDGILARFRSWIDPTGEQDTWLARGVNCPYCIGFYVSLIFALLLAHQTPTMQRSETLLAWFGIAGGAALLQKWTDQIA